MMRILAFLTAGALTAVLVAACGGSQFTSSGRDSDAGGSSGSSGGSSNGGSSGGGSGSGSGSGGSGSSSGSSGSSSGTIDAGPPPRDGGGSVDGGLGTGDASSCTFPPTRCGAMTCSGASGQQGSLCCVDTTQAVTPFSCASCSCGCATQLECAVSADCGAGKVCCAEQRSCGGGSKHWVATCTSALNCMGQRLCNPSGNSPLECTGAGTSCSPDTGGVGIPSNTGYGVCQ